MTSGILQTMAGLFVRNESLATALAAPRVHTKLSRLVWLEHPADTVETLAALEDRFRKVEVRKQHSYAMGCVQAIQFLSDGRMLGAADPRRDGTAAGL